MAQPFSQLLPLQALHELNRAVFAGRDLVADIQKLRLIVALIVQHKDFAALVDLSSAPDARAFTSHTIGFLRQNVQPFVQAVHDLLEVRGVRRIYVDRVHQAAGNRSVSL